MGSPWAVLVAEEDPQERGIMTLLVEAKAEGVEGRGGGGVEQQEEGEDPMATQPERESELSQTNKGVQGVCVGVVPLPLGWEDQHEWHIITR